jgi:solute carrier family 35 protein E1
MVAAAVVVGCGAIGVVSPRACMYKYTYTTLHRRGCVGCGVIDQRVGMSNERKNIAKYNNRNDVYSCHASSSVSAAQSSPDDDNTHANGTQQKVKVVTYIMGWYAFNIIFNILNKSCLNVFPAPWFLATFQLCASAVFMMALWGTGLQKRPRVSPELIKALLPVAFFHTVGHVSACVSFSHVAVSFTHVVKSAEPVLSVILSQLFLKEVYPFYVWASLLPIVVGCSLAAVNEVSFAWAGFNNAMISNLGMVLRNVYSKKYLDEFKDIDGINMFALLSILSIFITAPVAVVVEGFKGGVYQWGAMADAATQSLGGDFVTFLRLVVASGIFYHLYNQASYMVLGQGISPVTFSVGNTMKRVAVVVSSVVFFQNPVSPMNWLGSMLALLGTGLYSAAKQKASSN